MTEKNLNISMINHLYKHKNVRCHDFTILGKNSEEKKNIELTKRDSTWFAFVCACLCTKSSLTVLQTD